MTTLNEIRGNAVPPEAWARRALPVETRDFTALDYLRFIHPVGSHGVVRIGARVNIGTGRQKRYVFRERRFSVKRIRDGHASVVSALTELAFHTFCTFPYPKPGEAVPEASDANLTSICANWIDLDYYGVQGLAGLSKGDVLDIVLRRCEEKRWPAPSYVMSSGRGMLIVWLYEVAPREVLPRWRAVQRTLNRAFEDLGHDATGLSPTHLYRYSGSYNPNAKSKAYMLWPFYTADVRRGTFDELAAAVMPVSRRKAKLFVAEKLDGIAKRAAKRAGRDRARREEEVASTTAPAAPEPKKRRERVGGHLTGRSYWQAIAADIERLRAHRFGGKRMAEETGRSTMAFAATMVQAWVMPACDLDGWVRDQAHAWGLDEEEALSCTSGIRKAARDAANGGRKFWLGKEVDPRYRPGPKRLIELLKVQPHEMGDADMRILVNAERRKSVVASRQATLRRTRGAKARTDQQSARLAVGAEALRLRRDEGLDRPAIAARLGVTTRYLDTALRDAKAIEAIGTVTAPDTPIKPRRSHGSSRGTSRAKVGNTSVEAPVALVAPEGEAYTGVVTVKGTYLPDDARCAPHGPAGVSVPEEVSA
ncbi:MULTISPECIES: hypothetical protein [Methylobacterium]|uniref:hypothetical protein n=1 Tax=Methylobacterium TaxID=407 RepID=UPI00272E38AB|nr:hypothetical protein [Methylobacterium sp.]